MKAVFRYIAQGDAYYDQGGLRVEKEEAWAATLACQIVSDECRKSRRLAPPPLVELPEDETLGENFVSFLTPERMADLAEVQQHLPVLLERVDTHLLARLHSEQKQVVELYHANTGTFKDVAARLGLPLGTTMMRYCRAMLFLDATFPVVFTDWRAGSELFGTLLDYPKRMTGVLALRRIYREEGAEALNSLLETVVKSRDVIRYKPDE